ncbi:MAG: ATP-binding cassette domain-containing protein [Cuspidothrix sp.]
MTNHQLPITNYQTEAIKVGNLYQNYGKLAAVKGINFTVNKGEMFGLIGPDGAGKTTTFHILGGVMAATEGEVLVFGQPARDARLMTGYLTQQFSLYLDLSIDENLRYAGGLRQVDDDLLWERRHKYLSLMSLEQFGDRLDVLVENITMGENQVNELLKPYHPNIEHNEPTLENVFVTRLRQQGSTPPFLQFPRSRGGSYFQLPITNYQLPSSQIAIYANNLNRVFGKFQAVKSVNIEVRYGEIFGLLGANGAGKTTTIKMLCGLLAASGGEISLGGETGNLRSAKLRKRIGYMSQKFTLYDDLTILQNLEFYSGVYSVPRKLRREKIDWVISTCGLEGQENMLTGQLPGGWKQRVAFGASVMHEPDILFLDEPTSGVDPLARRQFWKLINDFARNGTAILVTTHYLEEAEQCNRMSFMVAGEIAAEGSPSYIKASQPGKLIEIIVNQNQTASKLLKQKFDSWRVSIFANSLHIVLDNPETEIPQVIQILKSANFTVKSFRPIPFSLEDAFIGIVQRVGNNY